MASQVELGILITAKDLASNALEGVHKNLGGLGEAGKLAMVGIAAMGTAAVAGVTSALAMADATAAAAMEVRKLSRETGIASEFASALRYEGERLNINTDDLSKSFGIFSKNLETHAGAMAKLGVEIMKTDDGNVDLSGTLGLLADQFKAMPDGVEKTALSMQLFGKSGKDMIPLLNQGSEGMMNARDEATKLGLVFSKDGTDAAFKFGQAQKDLSDQFEGLRNKVGMAVMPALTELFKFLAKFASDVLPNVVSAIKPVMDILGELFDVLTGRAPDAGAALTKAIGPDAAKVVMGALAGIRDTAKEVFEKVGDAIQVLKDHWDFFGPAFAAIALTVIVPAMIAWSVAAIAAATATFIALLPVLIPLAAIGAAVGLLALAWNSNFGDIRGKTEVVVGVLQDLFAGFRDLMAGVWNAIQTAVANAINNVIKVLNIFIEGYDKIAEKLGKPLIGTIDLITPNLLDVNAAINDVARDRYAKVFLQQITQQTASEHSDVYNPPPPSGGAQPAPLGWTPGGVAYYAEGTSYVPRNMLAFLHQGEAVIPASQNTGGANVTINIGTVDSDARVRQLADAVGAVFLQRRRSAGLA